MSYRSAQRIIFGITEDPFRVLQHASQIFLNSIGSVLVRDVIVFCYGVV